MAYYLVRSKPGADLTSLKAELDSDSIFKMRPFGQALDFSLKNARIDAEGYAVWEEEDYCTPPLAMERAAVLDKYFTELTVERVQRDEGWQQIEELPSLWDR
jgi:hypothetical protein